MQPQRRIGITEESTKKGKKNNIKTFKNNKKIKKQSLNFFRYTDQIIEMLKDILDTREDIPVFYIG